MNCSVKQTINIFVTITRLTVEPRKKVQVHFLKNKFTRLQRDEFSVYLLSLEKKAKIFHCRREAHFFKRNLVY